jgi:hypothetical protein
MVCARKTLDDLAASTDPDPAGPSTRAWRIAGGGLLALGGRLALARAALVPSGSVAAA